MDVLTVRVPSEITKAITQFAKEKNESMADVARELMTLAVKEKEKERQLELWKKKKITLRTLAKNLNISLWEAQDLTSAVESPYSKADLQRDLKLI